MFETTSSQDECTFKIEGRFDFSRVPEFQRMLKTEATRWRIDLTQVSYVDSAALGMLLLLRDRVHGDPQRVRIQLVHGQARDVLMMARFDRMFTLETA